MTSKSFFQIISGILLLAIIVPTPALAVATSSKATGTTAFCAKIDEVAAKFGDRVAETNDKLTEFRDNRESDLGAKRTERDQKLADARKDADEKRDAEFKALNDKAATDAEKQAVNAFKTTVTAAIKTRRDAVDAANTEFRKGIDEAIKSRQTVVDPTRAAFKDAVMKALDKAKAECADNPDSKTVREILRTSLKASKTTLVADLKSIEKPKINAEALAKARKAAIDKAFVDFKKTVEKARADLKKVFAAAKTTTSGNASTTTQQ